MRETRQHSITIAGLLLLAAAAFFPRGTAVAQVPNYLVVNPIDVCAAGGTGCAPFGMNCTTFSNGSPNCGTAFSNPGAATATTPIGFVDKSTIPGTTMSNNINITRAIWLQKGIDVVFLPIKEYDSPANTPSSGYSYAATDYRTLHVVSVTCPTTNVTNLVSPDLAALTNYTLPCGAPSPNPPTAPAQVPPLYPDARVINAFFINSILGGTYNGFSWINGDGIAIAKSTFGSLSFDTFGHEVGHVFNLNHATLGATTPCTGTQYPFQTRNQCNLMAAGTSRVVPSSSGCSANSTTSPGGELYDIDTMLCGSSMPSVAQADQLLPLGTNSTDTGTQQGMALASNFLNPVASVTSQATAGGGTTSTTAAPATTTTTTSTSSAINFSVNYVSDGRPNSFIVALLLALPANFQFGTPAFFNPGGTAQVFGTPTVLNTTTEFGNPYCRNPTSGDDEREIESEGGRIDCLLILFKVTEPTPGTFTGSFNTTNNTFTFSSVIIHRETGLPATPVQLASRCVVTPGSRRCLDLTFVFNELFATTGAFARSGSTLTASSQAPNIAVQPTIVSAAVFPNLPSDYPPGFMGFGILDGSGKACTMFGDSTSCPPGTLPQCESEGGACD